MVDQNTAEGHSVAKRAYERAPTNVKAVTTYAFSLYGLGRSAEGIEVMKKLSAAELRDPHTAVYLAVLLLDENQVATAREYLALAETGPVFPEEKKLLEEAMAKANPANPTPTPAPSPKPAP